MSVPDFTPVLADRVCHQQGLSLWSPFQNAATAVTNLYKGNSLLHMSLHISRAQHCWINWIHNYFWLWSVQQRVFDAHKRSFDLGIQIGHQRRNKDVLAWVKKRRRTIRREELISFLCGKAPPPRTSRAAPKLTVMSPNRPPSSDTVSSVETDYSPSVRP